MNTICNNIHATINVDRFRNSFFRAITCLLTLVVPAVAGFAKLPYSGDDAVHGITQVNGLVDTYTGNLAFSTEDIVVAGAVGRHGLSWQRHATSRTSQIAKFFGHAHNWAHNWQWEMEDSGKDAEGRAAIIVREPKGWVHRFTEVSSGEWMPEPGVRDRVVSNGDRFTVLRLDAGEVNFVRTAQGFRMEKMMDAVGNTWSFDWENGRLVQVTEPAGRWLKVSYGTLIEARGAASAVVIKQVTASDGQVVRYQYEFLRGADYPSLTAVVYPDETAASYTYEEPRPGDRLLLTRAFDPHGDRQLRGRVFHYRQEPAAPHGQILCITSVDGKVIQSLGADTQRGERAFTVKLRNGVSTYPKFHAGGNPIEETDALGFTKKFEYSAAGRGYRIAETDELGRTTRFENDAWGNVLKTTYPDDSVKTWERDERGRTLAHTDELGRTIRYIRDERGLVTKTVHADGAVTEAAYNNYGQIVRTVDQTGAATIIEYDSRGLRRRVTNALGASTLYAYDDMDRLASVIDAHGNTTRYERDQAGRVIRTLFADGTATSVDYNDFGQLIRSVDAGGAARQVSYDEFGRIVSTTDAAGQITRQEYAPTGEPLAWDRPVRIVTPSGRITSISYDEMGRVAARTAAAGTKEAVTIRMAYDATGRRISSTNALGKTTQFFHDARGRRTKTMTALNHAKTVEYDATGRKLSETDAKGNTTRWTYDNMGRELTKTDAKGQVTRREYNAAGRLVALIDAKLNTYRFEYDLLGRQTALVYPDGSRETTAYDAAGRKVSSTNRAGIVRTFAYDNRNREILSEWSDGSQKIVKDYDEAGRMILEDNGVSRLTFSYDEAGRLVSEIQDLSPVVTGGAFDPAPRVVSYAYNTEGQRASLTYPDGSFVEFEYDDHGRLVAILGDGIPPPIASYDYDRAGNATRMPRENDTETEREFDAENKVTDILEHGPGRRSPLADLAYTYDEAGNRTSTLATHDRDDDGHEESRLDAYHYDATYQVIGADYGSSVTGVVPPAGPLAAGAPASSARFNYDAVGNRLSIDENGRITRYTVNNLNQYSQVGDFALAHDRNGNLVSMGRWLYRYDAMNRLTEATDGVTMAWFWYDARNRCVARQYAKLAPTGAPLSSTLQLNTYDNWNLIEERDGRGAQQARYVHGRRIDEIVVMLNQHGTFYPHHDVLGNVTMLTGKDGRLVERYEYTVTGQLAIRDAEGGMLTDSAVENRWMFTGREWLNELGLYDYRNRIYSAEQGRFMQSDPIRFSAGDINIYRYVNNAYLLLTDPEGLAAGGIRINTTATIFGGVDFSIGVYWDDQGGFDVLAGAGGAVAAQAGFNASATLGWTITNADSVEDLRGWGYSAGVTAAAGAAVEKNYVWGDGYFGTDAGIGIGMPGAAIQGAATHTWSLVDAFDSAIDSIKSATESLGNLFGGWWNSLTE